MKNLRLRVAPTLGDNPGTKPATPENLMKYYLLGLLSILFCISDPSAAAAAVDTIEVTLDQATAWRSRSKPGRIKAKGTFSATSPAPLAANPTNSLVDMTTVEVTVTDGLDLDAHAVFTSCTTFPSGSIRCQNDDRSLRIRYIPSKSDPDTYRYKLDLRRLDITDPQVAPLAVRFEDIATGASDGAKNEPCAVKNAKLVCKGESMSTNPCEGQVDGTTCDDEDPATTGEVCVAESCVDLCAAVVCTVAEPQCQTPGTCDALTGSCSAPVNVNEAAACDDGDANTTSDVCTSGVCAGVDLCLGVVCTVTEPQCQIPGTCDPQTGLCSAPVNVADGLSCDDGDPATTGEQCTAGECSACPCNTPDSHFRAFVTGALAFTPGTNGFCNNSSSTALAVIFPPGAIAAGGEAIQSGSGQWACESAGGQPGDVGFVPGITEAAARSCGDLIRNQLVAQGIDPTAQCGPW